MSTKKISELTVLDVVNANLQLTVLPVIDTSSGTTRKVTLQQLNDSIEANIPFAAAAFTQANTAVTNASAADVKATSAGVYANSAFTKANSSLNVNSGGSITGDLSITGNLTITGCTATLSVSTMRMSDHIIDIGYGTTSTPTQNAGIRVIRGDDSPVQIRWNEVSNIWQYTNDGTEYYDFSNVTSDQVTSAYNQANTATTNAINSGSYANSAYIQANTSNTNIVTVGDYANSAFVSSNTADQKALSAGDYANSGYIQANTANTNAATADQKASSAGDYANAAYVAANTSDQKAVIVGSYANSAFNAANTGVNIFDQDLNTSNNVTFNDIASSNLDVAGTTSLTQVDESFTTISDATGVVTHDCSTGQIFNHTSIDANFTANFTNLNLANGKATTITLVLNQGGTAYIPNAAQIQSSAQTIRWSANTVPTGNTNAVDVVSFSILNNSGTYIVLGQLSTFG